MSSVELTSKDEILERLKDTYYNLCDERKEDSVLISALVDKAGFKSGQKEEIFALFGVKKYADICKMIPGAKIITGDTTDQRLTITVPEDEEESEVVENDVEQTEPAVSIPERIQKILECLNGELYGKDEAVRLALLSAIAGESIFFIGPPGTAKSMISRRIALAFKDIDKETDYFEYLMNEFSTPDEICGPVSLVKLNEDEYVRKTEGYLPKAKVAFLDEIWKSGPAILNTLLTIINEKKYHNGKNVEKVPLVSLAAASNELPERNRGLEALWDRFIIRVIVNPITNDEDFFKLVETTNQDEVSVEEDFALTVEEVKDWQQKISQIELSEEAKAVITAIRKEFVLLNNQLEDENEKWYVSDRRWKKIVHLIKTSAFLNGREEVDLMDCSLIGYCIWNTDSQQENIKELMEKILQENGIDCANSIADIEDDLDDFKKSVDKTWYEKVITPASDMIVTIDRRKYYECISDNDGRKYYVSVNSIDSYSDGPHRILNSTQQHIRDNSFSRNGDTIICYSTFTVQKAKPKEEDVAKLFDPVAYPVRLQEFNCEFHQPIFEKIQGELDNLSNFKEEHETSFKANIFAEQEISSVLLRKLDKSIKALQDLQVKLEQEKTRYEGISNIKTGFSIEEIILVDGSVHPAEYKLKENEQKIAQVCFTDNAKIPYGLYIGREQLPLSTFTEAQDLPKTFCSDFPPPYDSGWRLPTIQELELIYENETIREYEKFWSSTKNEEDGGVYYLDFDTGEKDHTSSSHSYGVILIRKLAE